ncbi:unnamed protein product [Ilex paraguariensis]|uniref:Uncharacterized protein n=1 Tax=Ilex paraguariensis TaxID=185542 RepID=A0ABC8QNU7_9AQUA
MRVAILIACVMCNLQQRLSLRTGDKIFDFLARDQAFPAARMRGIDKNLARRGNLCVHKPGTSGSQRQVKVGLESGISRSQSWGRDDSRIMRDQKVLESGTSGSLSHCRHCGIMVSGLACQPDGCGFKSGSQAKQWRQCSHSSCYVAPSLGDLLHNMELRPPPHLSVQQTLKFIQAGDGWSIN